MTRIQNGPVKKQVAILKLVVVKEINVVIKNLISQGMEWVLVAILGAGRNIVVAIV